MAVSPGGIQPGGVVIGQVGGPGPGKIGPGPGPLKGLRIPFILFSSVKTIKKHK